VYNNTYNFTNLSIYIPIQNRVISFWVPSRHCNDNIMILGGITHESKQPISLPTNNNYHVLLLSIVYSKTTKYTISKTKCSVYNNCTISIGKYFCFPNAKIFRRWIYPRHPVRRHQRRPDRVAAGEEVPAMRPLVHWPGPTIRFVSYRQKFPGNTWASFKHWPRPILERQVAKHILHIIMIIMYLSRI
jgi:hypothetical protein